MTGDPGPNVPAVRTLEHDVAGLTATNPYAGGSQNIANYLADPAEEAILHMVNADPARTPTFAAVRQAGLLPVQRRRRPAAPRA